MGNAWQIWWELDCLWFVVVFFFFFFYLTQYWVRLAIVFLFIPLGVSDGPGDVHAPLV